MKMYYQTLTVNGVVNETEYSSVFTSTEAEQKYLIGMYLYVSGVQGNKVLVTQDRETLATIDDHLIGQNENPQQSFWNFDFQVPQGSQIKIGVQSGGTASNVTAVLAYNLPGG